MGFGGDYSYDDGLHTPNQNVPMQMCGGGTAGPSSFQERNDWNLDGYRWKDSSRMFSPGCGSWNEPTYFDPARPREMSLGFSREDIEYAKLSERKNREVVKNMNDRQKRLLRALEKGMLLRLSKLVPVKNDR